MHILSHHVDFSKQKMGLYKKINFFQKKIKCGLNAVHFYMLAYQCQTYVRYIFFIKLFKKASLSVLNLRTCVIQWHCL